MGEQPQGNGTQPARNDASNLRAEDAPEITYVNRDPIDRSDEAYADIPA